MSRVAQAVYAPKALVCAISSSKNTMQHQSRDHPITQRINNLSISQPLDMSLQESELSIKLKFN